MTSYYLSPVKCVKKTPHLLIPTLTSSTQGIIQNSTQDHIQFKAKYLHWLVVDFMIRIHLTMILFILVLIYLSFYLEDLHVKMRRLKKENYNP